MTATAVMRLVEDGRLSLNDPVARYVPAVANGTAITLRMLLNHTSGVREADLPSEASGGRTEAERLSGSGCPGAAWAYSNAGYALLGTVIEAATGTTFRDAVIELVLSRSVAPRIRPIAPDDELNDLVRPSGIDGASSFEIRTPQAAAGILADAESMALLLRDVLAGRVLPQPRVEQMLAELYPMSQQGLWYGLGLMAYDVPGNGGTSLWIGHSGGSPGAKAVVAFAPAREAIVAVALTGNGSAEATANLLLGTLEPTQ